MDEGRKRVIGIMAAILANLHMQTADDLFGGPQGSPRTDELIAASVQWAEKIMEKIDERFRELSAIPACSKRRENRGGIRSFWISLVHRYPASIILDSLVG
jgi:hypothetical protein